MKLQEEIQQLRQHLESLAARSDDDLNRYRLASPPLPPGMYWQARWLVGWILRRLETLRLKPPNPWPASLKHGVQRSRAKPLLIWAVGMNPDSLRTACDGIAKMCESAPDFAPVLVTDVADFSYFSRLGWLVEYLPELSGHGDTYGERKAMFLSRLYKGAPVLPASAGLVADTESGTLAHWLAALGR
ncbi:MAG TPA: hypothetical protein PKK10_07590 [Woeseiaceae bacterium]|nr:hypothetical protein [Woeseiaceae bacterium]